MSLGTLPTNQRKLAPPPNPTIINIMSYDNIIIEVIKAQYDLYIATACRYIQNSRK